MKYVDNMTALSKVTTIINKQNKYKKKQKIAI